MEMIKGIKAPTITRRGKVIYRYLVAMLLGLAVSMSNYLDLRAMQQQSDPVLLTQNIKKNEYHAGVLKKVISVDLHNATLEKGLEMIAQQAGLKLVYSENSIPAEKRVYLHNKHIILEAALWKLLEDTQLRFGISSHDHLVVMKSSKGIKTGEKQFQQLEAVSGTVTDANTGNTLPGVNIKVKGTTTGTATDGDGQYELTVESLQDTLVFSYIGYATKNVPVNGRTEIDIEMQSQAISGEEMVVVGYGEQKKRNITSSISTVTSKDLDNSPVQDFSQALQGKVAGVQIIHNAGNPGATAKIRIRGTGTVNNSEPLYVIDGNPGADPANLNSNQIESIEVLKSSSASAIYGARGANGVILITTKSGTPGNSNIQINYYGGVQQLHNSISMMNARQYAVTYNKALENAGVDPLFKNVESLGKGTDWQDAIFRSAPIHNVDVSFSGGTDQATYYIGTSYFQQKGIVIKNGYKKINFRIKSEDKINPVLTVGENLLLSYSDNSEVPAQGSGGVFSSRDVVSSALRMDPSVPVKNPDGSWGFPRFSDAKNPVAQANVNHISTTGPALNGGLYLDVNPLENLVFHSQFNLNYALRQYSNFIEYFNIYPIQRNLVPKLSKDNSRFTQWNWRNTLTFNTDIGAHSIKIMGGVATLSENTSNISASAQGIPINANTNPNLRYFSLAPEGQVVNGGAGEFSMLSYLGRINYSYKDTYLLTGNFRADGSSKFGKNSRYGYFPSFSVGWIISNEAFMDDIFFINELKIRGGWGEIGNQNSLPNYAFTTSLNTDLAYAYGQNVAVGQAPTSVGNPNLKWETTKETDIGVDFTGFENKVTFSGSYYYRKTSGMLLRVPVMDVTGVEQPPFTNGGGVVNKGFELNLGYNNNASSSEFNYDVSINFSRNINKVSKLSNNKAAIFSSHSETIVGGPIGAFFGYIVDGIFQSQQEVDNHATQTVGTAPGDIKFRDINNDGVITQNDRTIIGNPWPDFNYGLTSNFNWKQFDLSLSLQGVFGNTIFTNWKGAITETNNFYNYDTAMLGAWNGEGTSNTIPRLNTNDPNDNFRDSSFLVEDGSYLRLKNLQVGYTFPSGIFSNNIKSLRVYLSGQNLLTFTKYDGYDPEIGGSSPLEVNVDSGLYPQARIYTAGLRLSI